MRVATLSIYNSSQYQLSRTLLDYNKANTVVTTGKKLQTPSDDPVGYAQAMQLTSSLSHLAQLHRNMTTGLTWLTTSESTVDNIRETILDAKELALAMSNDSYNEDDIQSAADEVHEYLETLIDFANSKVNGKYLFSGTKTDTIPYALDESTDPPTVTYAGNDSAFTISIGTNTRIEVGYPGPEVFGDVDTGEDIFTLLIRMEEDLRSNGGDGLADVLEELDIHYNHTVDVISNIGIKNERLDTRENVISDLELTLTEQKSNLEDADLTAAITDLATKQTAYEAALAATSAIMSLSLVDYM